MGLLAILLNESPLAPVVDGLLLQADVTETLRNFNRLEIHWPLDSIPSHSVVPPHSADSDSPPAISDLVDVSLVISD